MTNHKKELSKVLVIGGCGFVGSNLCEHLVKNSVDVTSYDNYFTGSENNHIEGATYLKGETSNINEINFKKQFSHIYHLGEYSRVEQSFEDIDKVFEFNHQSIYQVLKFTKSQGAKLIYSGSSTKFGDNGDSVFESPYAFTKKANTDLIMAYAGWFSLDYAITYFYNVYGKREISDGNYATLIAKFTKLFKDGHSELPVVLPGNQSRNFTDIRDIVSALEMIGVSGSGDGYGIGAEESYTILVNMFGKKPLFLPARKGNRMSAPVKTEKTKSLGWKQNFRLKDYIDRILQPLD